MRYRSSVRTYFYVQYLSLTWNQIGESNSKPTTALLAIKHTAQIPPKY